MHGPPFWRKTLRGSFDQTQIFQSKYILLLSVCDETGTMVSQDRVLEKDKDIPPFLFFRQGTRKYVFPKREVGEVMLKEDRSHTIDPTEGYKIWAETQEFEYGDWAKVELEIKYKDADNEPELSVSVINTDNLPLEVEKTLDALMGHERG